MEIKTAKRVIKYEDQTLVDLNPAEPDVEKIVRMHAATIPALATAAIEGPVMEDGRAIYTVKTRVGTKG